MAGLTGGVLEAAATDTGFPIVSLPRAATPLAFLDIIPDNKIIAPKAECRGRKEVSLPFGRITNLSVFYALFEYISPSLYMNI